jgi:hypothetical protein
MKESLAVGCYKVGEGYHLEHEKFAEALYNMVMLSSLRPCVEKLMERHNLTGMEARLSFINYLVWLASLTC